MQLSLILLLSLITIQVQIPKNDPTGVWESTSGTRYELRLAGTQLEVKLVPGTNQRYLSYQVDLKNSDQEVNTYIGTGFFVAKVNETKECKYETEWQLTVITPNRIVGSTTNIIPDPETCGVKERSQAALDLRKK